MNKILIVSDIHGSKRAGDLIKKLDIQYNFKKIVILGDFLYNGPRNKVPTDYNPNYLIEVFNSLKDKIVAVRGNCDADVDLMVLNFDIPKQKELILEGTKFYLTHGDIESIYNFEPKTNELLLKGHTHLPVLFKNEFGGILLNPGSMTFPKGELDKSFMILDENDVILYEFNYDSSDNIEILRTFSLNKEEYLLKGAVYER